MLLLLFRAGGTADAGNGARIGQCGLGVRGQRQRGHAAVQGRADVIQVVVLGQKDHGEHGIGKQHPHRQGDGTAHAVLRVAPDAVGGGRAESAVAVVGCSGWCSFGANVHVHVVMFVRIILTNVVIRRTCCGCLPRFVVEVVLVSVVVVATVVSGGSLAPGRQCGQLGARRLELPHQGAAKAIAQSPAIRLVVVFVGIIVMRRGVRRRVMVPHQDFVFRRRIVVLVLALLIQVVIAVDGSGIVVQEHQALAPATAAFVVSCCLIVVVVLLLVPVRPLSAAALVLWLVVLRNGAARPAPLLADILEPPPPPKPPRSSKGVRSRPCFA